MSIGILILNEGPIILLFFGLVHISIFKNTEYLFLRTFHLSSWVSSKRVLHHSFWDFPLHSSRGELLEEPLSAVSDNNKGTCFVRLLLSARREYSFPCPFGWSGTVLRNLSNLLLNIFWFSLHSRMSLGIQLKSFGPFTKKLLSLQV